MMMVNGVGSVSFKNTFIGHWLSLDYVTRVYIHTQRFLYMFKSVYVSMYTRVCICIHTYALVYLRDDL